MILFNLKKVFHLTDQVCTDDYDIYLSKKDNVMYMLHINNEQIVITGLQVCLTTGDITIIHSHWESDPIVLTDYTKEYSITLWVVFSSL